MQHPTSTSHHTARSLADARYVALTTFTRDGTPKSTPVWPVDAGDVAGVGSVAFVTSTQTWKVQRIQRDCRVRVQPCDAKGRIAEGSTPITGTAEVVTGLAFEAVRRSVRAKYGYQLRIIDLLHALPGRRTGHPNDCAVVITFDRS